VHQPHPPRLADLRRAPAPEVPRGRARRRRRPGRGGAQGVPHPDWHAWEVIKFRTSDHCRIPFFRFRVQILQLSWCKIASLGGFGGRQCWGGAREIPVPSPRKLGSEMRLWLTHSRICEADSAGAGEFRCELLGMLTKICILAGYDGIVEYR
jgi:hypothetical protein